MPEVIDFYSKKVAPVAVKVAGGRRVTWAVMKRYPVWIFIALTLFSLFVGIRREVRAIRARHSASGKPA